MKNFPFRILKDEVVLASEASSDLKLWMIGALQSSTASNEQISVGHDLASALSRTRSPIQMPSTALAIQASLSASAFPSLGIRITSDLGNFVNNFFAKLAYAIILSYFFSHIPIIWCITNENRNKLQYCRVTYFGGCIGIWLKLYILPHCLTQEN